MRCAVVEEKINDQISKIKGGREGGEFMIQWIFGSWRGGMVVCNDVLRSKQVECGKSVMSVCLP